MENYRPSMGDLCCCVDVQYENEQGYVALALWEWGKMDFFYLLDLQTVENEYQPGAFAKREGPIVLNSIQKAEQHLKRSIHLLILDGHGTAHPKRAGLAAMVGQQLAKPTIGIAKDSLLKIPYELEQEAGAFFPLHWEGDWVGTVLRTQDHIKPIFVSVGYGLTQSEVVNLCFQLRGPYRQIEPIRKADWAARCYARGELYPEFILLPQATD